MGLTMAQGESATNKSGVDLDRTEKMHDQFPSYVLEEAGQTLSRADAIKKDPKLMAAAAEHHAHRAEEHKKMSREMQHHMKRGLVSEEALKKAASKHGKQTARNEGKGRGEMAPKEAEKHGNRDQSQSKEHGSRGGEHLGKAKGTRR